MPVAVSVTDTALVAASSSVAVTVTDPPPSATVLLAAFVVNVTVDGDGGGGGGGGGGCGGGCGGGDAAVTVAVTEETVSPLYCESVLVAAWVIVDVPASTPVTVNDCAVSQLAGVNVRDAGDTVALAVEPLVGVTVTFAVGLESNTTVYLTVAPSTTDTVVSLTVTPWVSSSVIVTVTPITVKPLTYVVKTMVSLPSSTLSLVVCTVPVAVLWPFAMVNAPGSV